MPYRVSACAMVFAIVCSASGEALALGVFPKGVLDWDEPALLIRRPLQDEVMVVLSAVAVEVPYSPEYSEQQSAIDNVLGLVRRKIESHRLR